MFRGITKTLNKFQKKNDDLASSQFKSSISNFEISSSPTNNENDLLNSQIFNSNNNSYSNNIKNSQIENEIPNRNQNIISSQSRIKQEIPIRNPQLSTSQSSNYRRPRQNPLNNRYPSSSSSSSSSYKRSNTPTSKCKYY
ncbi:hypothetical protein PIROE2DRAFT_4027 [Piromyces sp. E2]|nr:hypothetical protein PIROE2DRAFT_4027 [Piromyces sp. E2]|eukprot:OUM68284.1 hypothetical protein PIROE2DRAFT_4027 [Piromyces sp. E2]